MGRLLLIALFGCACHFYRVPQSSYQMVSQDEVEDLLADVAQELRCPEDQVESRPLTLLTRLVWGCGHERVYAWDALREQWVLSYAFASSR
jgi:hypothetical protein